MTEAECRQAIVEAARAMNATGLNQGMSGNISVRCGETILITPTATPYDRMKAADIAAMPIAGESADAIEAEAKAEGGDEHADHRK